MMAGPPSVPGQGVSVPPSSRSPRQARDPVERLPLHLGRPTQNIDDMHSHRPGSPSAAPLIAGGTLAEPIATVAPRERHPALPSPRGQPSNFPLDKTGFREYKSG